MRITYSRPQASPNVYAYDRKCALEWYTLADNPEMQTVRVRLYCWMPAPYSDYPRGEWKFIGTIVLVTGETFREWWDRHVFWNTCRGRSGVYPALITPDILDTVYAFRNPYENNM